MPAFSPQKEGFFFELGLYSQLTFSKTKTHLHIYFAFTSANPKFKPEVGMLLEEEDINSLILF